MTEHDPVVEEMLEEHVPLRLDAEPDWTEIVRLAASSGVGQGGRTAAATGVMPKSPASRGLVGILGASTRSRRLRVFALAGVVVCIGAAIATASSVRWWKNSGPPSAIQTNSAQKLVEYTLTSGYSIYSGGTTIAMWRLPQEGGAVCYLIALASSLPTGNDGANPLGQGVCGPGPEPTPPGNSMRIAYGAEAPDFDWMITGSVNPASGITGLELHSATGRLPISYANGWFIAQLPASGSPDKLPPGGPYVIVGRDNKGDAVKRVDLAQDHAALLKPQK